MNQFSISLGKPFGIPTRIHWTFWLLILWIIYSNASEGQSQSEILWYIAFVFSIFACVVLHEFGHALAARRYGVQTSSITILPIGGVASLEKNPDKPKQELVVAIAGPMVNVLIAAGLWAFLSMTGKLNLGVEQVEAMTNINGDNFLVTLLTVNIMLVVFNMIPAFPMDGGRVLRAFLAMNMSRVKATEWAVNIGKVFAIIFVFWGFSSNPFLVFIALFIFMSAQMELEHVRSEGFLGDYRIGDVIMKDYTLLDASYPLAQAVKVLLNGQEKSFLVKDDNRIVGYLTKDDIIKGLTNYNEQVAIGRIASPNLVWLKPETLVNAVRIEMAKSGIPIMPVGSQGRLLGVVDLDNINEFLLVQGALRSH